MDVKQVLPEEEDHYFREMLDGMPQLAWMAYADGFIFWYNRRWYEYTGTTPEQMAGWGWQSVHDPVVLPVVMDRWKRSINTKMPFDMEFPLRSKDGPFRWFLTRIIPVCDADGNVTRWFGTNTDIHELRITQDALRRSEQRLRISEERLRLTQRAANIGSWEFDLDREEYYWSPEVYQLFELPLNPMANPKHANLEALLYFSGDREELRRAFNTAVRRNREYSTAFRIKTPAGGVKLIAARGKPYFNQGRNLLMGVFIDIGQAEQESREQPTQPTGGSRQGTRKAITKANGPRKRKRQNGRAHKKRD